MEQKYIDLIIYLLFIIPIYVSSIYIFISQKHSFINIFLLNTFFYITLYLSLKWF